MTVHIAGSRGVLGWVGGGGGRTGGDGGDLDREGAWAREGGKDGERGERLGLGNVWKKGSRIEG